jgi:hypothetical protein
MSLFEWKFENDLIFLTLGNNDYYYPTSKELYFSYVLIEKCKKYA